MNEYLIENVDVGLEMDLWKVALLRHKISSRNRRVILVDL